jgi:hypothetical protein
MVPRRLEKTQWREFFDQLSKLLIGRQVEIEVASLALGSQIEAKGLPLLGIAYDPKNDILEIALEGIDHLIHKPREIYVDGNPVELAGLEVIDTEGTRQIIQLRDSLALPPTAKKGQEETRRG